MNKTLLKSLLALSFVSIFTGCAVKDLPREEATIISENKYDVRARPNNELKGDAFKIDLIKRTLKKTAETTLEKGYTNFAIVNSRTNNLDGFPVNTYKNLKDFCLNEMNSYECQAIIHENGNIIVSYLLREPDYRIISFDAKQVLEDIKKEEIK